MRDVAIACVAALCLTSCAGTPRSETVPMCPSPDMAALDGYDLVLDELDRTRDSGLAEFVRYFEELQHYCRRVLPAWRD